MIQKKNEKKTNDRSCKLPLIQMSYILTNFNDYSLDIKYLKFVWTNITVYIVTNTYYISHIVGICWVSVLYFVCLYSISGGSL